jgi:hypothetical protein
MEKCYENIPSNQIEKQKKYLYGAMINILYLYDDNSPFIDATIQNLRNQILGLNALFNFQPQILTIVSNLETARKDHSQLRSCILSAANLVDTLQGGDSNV